MVRARSVPCCQALFKNPEPFTRCGDSIIFLGGVHLYHKDDIEKFEKEWLRPKKPQER